MKTNVEAVRVALLVDTSTGWGRRLVRGASKFALQHGAWHFWVEPRGRSEKMELPAKLKFDGVIARVATKRLAQDLAARKCKVVNVSSIELPGVDFPSVTSNESCIAEMAAEHFETQGLRHVAYVGPLSKKYVKRHQDSFRDRCRATGHLDHHGYFNCVGESLVVDSWATRRSKMLDWLRSLPKPTGIFCWGTSSAMQVLEVCRDTEFNIPDDISVLAGDDDELLCESTTPTLSAIVTASEQIGFEAAKILQQCLENKKPEMRHLKIDPIQVVSRQSTDALAIADQDLRMAMRFIRENACNGISIQDIADFVAISRRGLERRFKEAFLKTPLDEIQRIRLLKVKELLRKTDLPIPRVAAKTGFGTPEYLATVFKAATGTTPLKYRTQVRAR